MHQQGQVKRGDLSSCGGLVIDYSGQKLRLRSEQRGNPSGHWTASWAGSVYPTPMSVRRDLRSKRPPRSGLQTICRKISLTLCRQRLSVEGSHEGGYPPHKGTVRSHQNGRQETGWGYTSPMGQRKIHRLGFHSHPHVCASYLHLSSSVPGGTAEHAADRHSLSLSLSASHEFVPIAVE